MFAATVVKHLAAVLIVALITTAVSARESRSNSPQPSAPVQSSPSERVAAPVSAAPAPSRVSAPASRTSRSEISTAQQAPVIAQPSAPSFSAPQQSRSSYSRNRSGFSSSSRSADQQVTNSSARSSSTSRSWRSSQNVNRSVSVAPRVESSSPSSQSAGSRAAAPINSRSNAAPVVSAPSTASTPAFDRTSIAAPIAPQRAEAPQASSAPAAASQILQSTPTQKTYRRSPVVIHSGDKSVTIDGSRNAVSNTFTSRESTSVAKSSTSGESKSPRFRAEPITVNRDSGKASIAQAAEPKTARNSHSTVVAPIGQDQPVNRETAKADTKTVTANTAQKTVAREAQSVEKPVTRAVPAVAKSADAQPGAAKRMQRMEKIGAPQASQARTGNAVTTAAGQSQAVREKPAPIVAEKYTEPMTSRTSTARTANPLVANSRGAAAPDRVTKIDSRAGTEKNRDLASARAMAPSVKNESRAASRLASATDRRTASFADGSGTTVNRTVINKNTTIINNNNTVVVNSDRSRDRSRWEHGNWWRPGPSHYDRHYDFRDHHDYHGGLFVSINFGHNHHYRFCSWAPIVYEPIYTPIWNPVIVYDPVIYEPVTYQSTYITGTSYTTVTWPSYRQVVCYTYGPSYTVSYVYPHYHRRYVFVSVGGYWPAYTYSRYYWYGCHPYIWYGAEPQPVLVQNTTNVYTYTPGALVPGTTYAGVEVPDYDGLNVAGQKIKMQASQDAPVKPNDPTEADKLFDDAVKQFGQQDYAGAIEKLRTAVRLEPTDTILPFAYAQALFANNEYEKAAAVLCTALSEMGPKQQEVYYPRGMYTDEKILDAQVKNLERAVLMDPQNAQMQLLLGYHLLGIGKFDQARTPLEVAQRNGYTQAPAMALLALMERIKNAPASTDASKTGK